MKHALIAATLVAALLPALARSGEVPADVLEAQRQRVDVMARAGRAAVSIFAASGNGGGSGVIISPDGYAVSNFHVTSECGADMKCGLSDGRLYDAVIVGVDPTGDVALLKLLGRDDFPCAEIGDSDSLQVGQWVFAIGNPFLLATDFQPTVTYGIVSGLHRYQYPTGGVLEYPDCIQTDASINPGNSGGPLFNSAGQLVGINGRGSFEKRGRVNVGVAYAITIGQIERFLSCLRSGRIVDHASMGATVASDGSGRVVVTEVLTDSDAYRRGLRSGDEIVALAGRPVDSANTFKNILGTLPAEWRVSVTLRDSTASPAAEPPKPESDAPEDVPVPATTEPTRELLVRLRPMHRTGELKAVVRSMSEKGQPEEPAGDEEHEKPKLPASVAAVYEAGDGFANQYFNRSELERVARLMHTRRLQTATGRWHVEGQLEGGGGASFDIDDDGVTAVLPAGKASWKATTDLGSALDPPGSGGMFAALYLWRKAIVGGIASGDAVYLGAMPLGANQMMFDAWQLSEGGVHCRYYIDPSTGDLHVAELFTQEDGDPCELRFADFQTAEGRTWPARMEVFFGDDRFGAVRFGPWQASDEK